MGPHASSYRTAATDGQIVCMDFGRWGVQRAFNRRLKKRLQELAIEIDNPLRRLVRDANTARTVAASK